MSHVKAGGATAQQSRRPGKRRGLKKFGGERVITGNIIVRQVGSRIRAGQGVGVGRDYTLFALCDGIVSYFVRKSRQFVSVK